MKENIKGEVTQSILNQFILSTNIYCRAMCSTLLGAEETKTDKLIRVKLAGLTIEGSLCFLQNLP